MPDLIIDKVIHELTAGQDISSDNLVAILSTEEVENLSRLFAAGDQKRKEMVGDVVLLRGIIEISNVCSQNCQYCGLRKDNRHVLRYRMPEEEIVSTAKKIAAARISTVVLQSGEDQLPVEHICTLIRRIKQETGLIVTLSLGDRTYDAFRCFREAGADRYLLKHETASKELFEFLRPGSSFENRRQCLEWLKALGFETGAGNMIGLPGQSLCDLAADLLYLRAFQPDMIGIGPFIPHPDTPLRDAPSGSSAMTLKVVALARLFVPRANIPATTALGVLDKGGRTGALQAGANVVMLDFTPEEYRRHYDIYPGKAQVVTEMDQYLVNLKDDLASLGRSVG
ncbi:MAG: [FeFe] hydrogenase H-cluster radical SAM maturase HydE [Syntrophaceae bacterium]|nr:[FeFe] hydrogenase H-cluster radical SAM maturase HydE [Syntrophaceae bacterium]